MTPGEVARAYRPCGACGDMVPAATGCKHWKPGTAATVRSARRGRAKQREYEKVARQRAVESVAQFLTVRAPAPGL